MLQTEQQRRWWFATHPEFSSTRSGRRHKTRYDDSDESDKPSPESVDAWADESLKYATSDVVIELLKGAKKWFGTEFASKSPEEQYELLWGAEDDDAGGGQNGNDWWSQQPYGHSTQKPDPHEVRLILPEGMSAHDADLARQALERYDRPLEADPHTALDLIPVGRFLAAPIQSTKAWLRSIAGGAVVSAAKRKATEGPGDWVEVGRGRAGLEHQSKMSGQRIVERDGKFRINEYKVPTDTRPVYFDDFRDGKLYEYKGSYAKFINKKRLFRDWFKGAKGAKNQADRQVRAAKGIPVIWKVGKDQVKAFKKAIGRIRGLSVEP